MHCGRSLKSARKLCVKNEQSGYIYFFLSGFHSGRAKKSFFYVFGYSKVIPILNITAK